MSSKWLGALRVRPIPSTFIKFWSSGFARSSHWVHINIEPGLHSCAWRSFSIYNLLGNKSDGKFAIGLRFNRSMQHMHYHSRGSLWVTLACHFKSQWGVIFGFSLHRIANSTKLTLEIPFFGVIIEACKPYQIIISWASKIVPSVFWTKPSTGTEHNKNEGIKCTQNQKVNRTALPK